MDEKPPMMPPELPAVAPKTSLAARLLNVFATPGEVFDEIKTSKPSHANWLVPVFMTCLVSALAAIIILSQPAILQKIREQQDQAMEKQVKAGKMTRQQADQAMGVIEKFSGPTMMKALGVMGAIVYGFGRLFWWATALWLLGMWILRVRFPYIKAMEVAGLAGMIGILGTLVTLLLQVNLSNPTASPSLAMLFSSEGQSKVSQVALAAFNIFDFWQLGVLAVALSRLANVPFMRGAFAMLTFWIITGFIQLLFAMAAMGLGG